MQEEKKLCECGCGEEVKPGKRFIQGHHHRCRSEETRQRFSEVRKGKKPSPETIEKLKEARKYRVGEKAPNYGKKHSEETKRKYSEDRKGKPNSCGPKISERNKQMWQDPEMREKWSASKRGENHPMFGKQHKEATKEKMSLSRQFKRIGVDSNWWKNGSTELHDLIHGCSKTRKWKKEVLKLDNERCVRCGDFKHVVVHHIKSVKDIIEENDINTIEDAINCDVLWDVNNGIVLCFSCHAKYHNLNNGYKNHIDIDEFINSPL